MNEIISSAQQDTLLASLGAPAEPLSASSKQETPDPSSHYAPGITSSIEEKAVTLLGMGVQADSVASALGVTPSRISQLLSKKAFADRVAKLRYENLQSHNKRDQEYDSLEDRLLTKLEKSLPLLVRPDHILKAIQVVNGAKRRGQSAPDTSSSNQNVVNLVLPAQIAQKFVTNIHNQVTKAGEQELLTIPSGNLLKQVEQIHEEKSNVQEEGR